ncbi:unnamed protein product [Boreogadus saida]
MPTHQCTVCDQTFGEKSNLARHLKIHAIARETFSCVVCGKSLATKPSLVSHQRLHQYPNIILYRQGEARLYCTEAARSVAEARSSTVVDPKWLDLKTAEAAAKRSGGELWKERPQVQYRHIHHEAGKRRGEKRRYTGDADLQSRRGRAMHLELTVKWDVVPNKGQIDSTPVSVLCDVPVGAEGL